MDQRNGLSVLRLESFEEWDEKILLLRRNFDVVQDEIGEFVQTAKQIWAAALTGAVDMQDVSTAFLHGVADIFSSLSMSMRQVSDEFLAQKGDFARR